MGSIAEETREPSPISAERQWVTQAVRAPRLQHKIFQSKVAGAEVSYHVYVPEIYEADRDRRFPVLYWLHGRGGGLRGLPRLVDHFDLAIREGKIPPLLIVFPNGLAEGMWCDSKDGDSPIETVVVEELIPHIDTTFHTIASREGRMIEGFSMGGYGAARFGLKYPDVFRAASILGAGPLQQEFTASDGPGEMARVRARVLERVYGGDQAYFKGQSPWILAEQNADAVRGAIRIRQAIGARDACLGVNRDFHGRLTRLKIPHSFHVIPDVGHHPIALLDGLGDNNWKFYRAVFEHPADADALPQGSSGPKTRLLVVGKATAADPARQQERAAIAVRKVGDAAEKWAPGIVIDALAENVMTKDEFRRGEVRVKVNGAIFEERLRQLAKSTTSQDTVIIYTHSHGTREGLEEWQSPGGLVLDPGGRRRDGRGIFSWKKYADLLLQIPAKNLVVLTMSCFSGGLVETFNSPEMRARWNAWRQEQGRNLIVLTSQNKDLPSPPIVKDGEVINPFTYAVAKALAGEADGFSLESDEPAQTHSPDGRLTVVEMIDFILYTTENTTSDWAGRGNNAKPQWTGSFGRGDVLIHSRAASPGTEAESVPGIKNSQNVCHFEVQ